ncbi:MAG: hypothetical protein WA051_03145 [Minisyncoccia bacterium]
MGNLIFLVVVVAAVFGYLHWRKKHNLTGAKRIPQDKVVERWAGLIKGAQGQGERVLKDAVRRIEELNAPHIHASRRKLWSGPGFFTTGREFVVVEHKVLDTHDMYIGARDYGDQLLVVWYLAEEPVSWLRWFKRNPVRALILWPLLLIARAFSHFKSGTGTLWNQLNLFDQEELTAYITTVHHSVLEAVKAMTEAERLDFTKVDSKTRGFLNIT